MHFFRHWLSNLSDDNFVQIKINNTVKAVNYLQLYLYGHMRHISKGKSRGKFIFNWWKQNTFVYKASWWNLHLIFMCTISELEASMCDVTDVIVVPWHQNDFFKLYFALYCFDWIGFQLNPSGCKVYNNILMMMALYSYWDAVYYRASMTSHPFASSSLLL